MSSGKSKQRYEDEELKMAFEYGDREAYARIFQTYRLMLIGFAFKFVHNEEIARDLVSDVFTRFWFEDGNFDRETQVKAFLHVSVRNACFNYIKARRYEVKKYKSFAEYQQANKPACDPSISWIFHKIDILDVRKEFGILSATPRKTLQLHLLGFSNKEIAQALGLAVQSVINARFIAQKSLRAHILPDLDSHRAGCHDL